MAVTTELLLTRHGEAHCNVAGIVGGPRSCTGLSDRGRQQVRALAQLLGVEHKTVRPVDVLYCGPRRRLRESGEILAAILNLPLHAEAGLDGPRWGEADGRPWHEIKEAFGGPAACGPDTPIAPGAETWNEYLSRAGAFLAELLRRHDGRRILIAGHGETIEAAHLLLLGLPTNACTRLGFLTDHACLTTWQLHRNRFGREVWILARHNDTTHLDPNTP